MADIIFKEALLFNKIDKSIEIGAYYLQQKAKEIVPRDWDRPPKALNFKGVRKTRPERKNGVVSKGGKYYNAVTGNLAKSIGVGKIKNFEYAIGVRKGPTEEYAKVQEFGSADGNIPSRSFLRESLKKNNKEAIKLINKNLANLLK